MRSIPDRCRDAAKMYFRDGYSVIPVTWDKVPHPYLISSAQDTLKELPWFYRGSYRLAYTGSFTLEPFYQAPQPQLLDRLFPPERVEVLWITGRRGGFEVVRIKGYGIAICSAPPVCILDFDLREAVLDAFQLAEKVAETLNTFTVVSPHRGMHVYIKRPDSCDMGWRRGEVELKLKGYCVAPPTKCFCPKCRAEGRGWAPVNYMPADELAKADPVKVVELVHLLSSQQ